MKSPLKFASVKPESVPMPSRRRLSLCAAVGGLVALTCVPSALAARSIASSNWAGYAVHRQGVSFRDVTARWTVPHATCAKGTPSFSAMWVGLGGYSLRSPALEQIGTELDCRSSGTAVVSAWYELVPAPSKPVQLIVRQGDEIAASVSALGKQIHLTLYDVTQHHGFDRTLRASRLDVSSAEWILEAPSVCTKLSACLTLPLANFGAAAFFGASAQTNGGHVGPISDSAWDSTMIRLLSGNSRFSIARGFKQPRGVAIPSPLLAGGGAFALTYASASSARDAQRGAVDLRASQLVHPAR